MLLVFNGDYILIAAILQLIIVNIQQVEVKMIINGRFRLEWQSQQ